MSNKAPAIDWKDILDKFYSYDGTITNFCRENSIKQYQLYYRRKNVANARETKETKIKQIKLTKNTAPSKPIFHAIDFRENNPNTASEKETTNEITPSKKDTLSNIKIEIGRAKIYLPCDNKKALSNIIKVVLETC